MEQAKRYSRGEPNIVGEWSEYKVPFLYSTNGELIFHLRLYQIEAIEKGVCDGKLCMLIAMATGTGKTVTLVSAISAFDSPEGLKFDKDYEVYSKK